MKKIWRWKRPIIWFWVMTLFSIWRIWGRRNKPRIRKWVFCGIFVFRRWKVEIFFWVFVELEFEW